MFAKAIVFSGLAAVASSHILMTNPVPYGKSKLKNGPLMDTGADFPCKSTDGVYDAEGASNVYAQGSKQQLEFKGTAVHGGGSCQVSITTDLKPTKSSVWKVIKSIEGGCPAKDQAGNMGDDAEAKVPYKYDYTIPKELAAGNYTLAWTWFNKIGNREMYMNCAPLAVTGDGGTQSFMDGLPDMLVANIGGKCKTVEEKDVSFPDPGKDVERFNGKTTAFLAPSGSCGKAGAGGAPSASAPGGGNAPNPTASAPGAGAPSASVPGGVFITSQNPQPDPTQAPSAGNPSVPPVGSSMPAPPSAPAPTGGSSPSPGSGHAAGSACSPEGQWNCIGGKSFQRCASGSWSVTQAMAAGVSCAPGESTELKMAAAPAKRFIRRALRNRV